MVEAEGTGMQAVGGHGRLVVARPGDQSQRFLRLAASLAADAVAVHELWMRSQFGRL